MRLLLIPHTGLRNIHSDSNYFLFIDLATYLTSKGHWCYILMPSFAKKKKVVRMSRLMYMYHDFIEYDFYTTYNAMDEDWFINTFSRRYGSELIDAIITSKASVVPQWQAILSDYIRCRDLDCCVIEPGVCDKEAGDVQQGRAGLMLMAMGYSQSISVYLTDYEKERAKRLSSKYLAPSCIRRIDEESIVMPIGIDTGHIDDITKGISKNKKFTALYAARLNTVKKPAKILELYDTMYRAGRNINIVVTTGTHHTIGSVWMNDILRGKPEIVVHYKCEKDKYLKIAAGAHVFICWSKSEGFPVGYYEQMYLGVIGIFPNVDWAVRQLPPGYKWIFSTKEEAYSMLMEIHDNYDSVTKEMVWMRDFILKQYKYKKVYSTLEKRLMKKRQKNKTYLSFKSINEMLRNEIVPQLPDSFGLDIILDCLEKYGRSFSKDRYKRGKTFRSLSDYDIHRILLDECGCIDLCNSSRPIYEKGKTDAEQK